MVKVAEEHRAPSGRGARPRGASDALALALALAGAVSPGWAHAGASPAGPVSSSNTGVQPSASANQIVDVESRADGQATSIRLRTTQTARFIVHELERPPRVVIDVPQARLAPALQSRGTRAGSTWSVGSWAVDRVTAHDLVHDGAQVAVRVVVWLARPARYRVANEGRDVMVRLVAQEAPDPAAANRAAADSPAAPAARARAADVPAAEAARLAAAAGEKAAALRAQHTQALSEAREARRAANEAVKNRSRSAWQLRMAARKKEAAAERLSARADAAERESERLRADAEQAEPAIAGSGAARRAAGESPAPSPAPTGDGAAVAAPAGPRAAQAGPLPPLAAQRQASAPPAPAAAGAAALRSGAAAPAASAAALRSGAAAPAAGPGAPTPVRGQTQAGTAGRRPAVPVPTATDYPAPAVASDGASAAPITQQTVSQVNQRRRKVYRGRKIDLDLKDADIHNLMRLLADVGGVNIVVPDNVKASITVRLRDVPWDQAMEVILASKGMWYRREGGLIRVAPRKELDAEDQAEAERLRALAESEAPETQVFTLNYAVADKVREQLTPLLSPKGRIETDERTNSLIINDISAHRRRIIGLVSQLDYQTPQIQIEARIVEARTTFNREFGIQWGGNVSASATGGNSTGLVFPNSVNAAGGADDSGTNATGVVTPSDFAVNLPAAVGTGAGGAIGISLGSVGGNVNLNLRLSAAEDSGTVRIISAPRITTSNNIEAAIKSGVSIPISVISSNGVQTQFVPADLLLRVTPAVSQRDCAISMQVNVTKNEADFVNTGARGDPSILTKEAKTTILVADGQTAVIGGIYTRNTGVAYSKVPFFADIPIFGWLFKSKVENDDRSEVLVFITPKITNRAFLRCQ